ncbi:hypothetical protein STAS_19919, partial [Striga asiatica]
MSASKDVQFALKVMINKEKTKVLFAEADSDFFNVLLSFLTLPLGKIAKILVEHYRDHTPLAVGSLSSLYNGLANLNVVHFHTQTGKQMLLNPSSIIYKECHKLKLNLSDSKPTKYFTCGQSSSGEHNFSMYYDSVRCDCGTTMRTETKFKSSEAAEDGDDQAFCTKGASFIIGDDMRLAPNVVGSVLRTLAELGISDTKGTEMRNVTFGYNEIIYLLRGMFVSRTPLTDAIIGKAQTNSRVFIPKTEEATVSNCEKKMILNVMLQKSTQKLIFAQAKDDFANFLFSLLTIPLGGALSLLGTNTGVTCLDNFYTSVQNINGDEYWETKDTKTKLRHTQLPIGYMSPNQLLPLTEGGFPELHYIRPSTCYQCNGYLSPTVTNRTSDLVRLKSPKGNGNYVKGSTMYMVTDDLTVTPLCVTSSLSTLDQLGIPLSDVEELELNVGLEEALSILKASLASTSALTDGLFGPSLRKCFTLKVMINKDKTKVLFAEADSDFTDVLLSFLTLPLGKIAKILVEHYGDDTPAIIDLLRGMFVSRTPLTDVTIGKAQTNSGVFIPKTVGKAHQSNSGVFTTKTEEATVSNSEKMMILTVMLQKSTQKFLFAQAKDGFADFLFSLLTIPLGGALSLLGTSTGVTSLDNFYMSVENINGDEYLKTNGTKTKLQKTQLPIGYMSPNHLFSLTEGGFPKLHFAGGTGIPGHIDYLSPSTVTYRAYPSLKHATYKTSNLLCLKSPKGNGNYVKGPTMYMVTDNLTVIPLCVTSSLSTLERLGILLSDVEELELNIGLEELLDFVLISTVGSKHFEGISYLDFGPDQCPFWSITKKAITEKACEKRTLRPMPMRCCSSTGHPDSPLSGPGWFTCSLKGP